MFSYISGELRCEGVPLSAIKEAVGSPTYVYSSAIIKSNLQAYQAADPAAVFAYALKANQNIEILKLIQSTGFGADVTSGGELYLALQAGFEPSKIIFSGVGKRDDEIRMALEAGISALHVESAAELDIIEQIAAELGGNASVGFRLNPNVNAETHPYISTGLLENKFGIPLEQGFELMQRAADSPHLRPVGVAMHIGSQIREIESFIEASTLVAELALECCSAGLPIEYIDVGGGLGINYATQVPDLTQSVAEIKNWVNQVGAPVREAGLRLKAEPGRSIVGPAGLLLAEITLSKTNGEKRFLVSDAGMNDLLRPPLYGASHPILPVEKRLTGSGPIADVVGPICESSDFLGKDRPLGFLKRGDLIAVMHAGAYGFAMSSNYNGRLRPAEVLVDGDRWRIIRPRETFAALL